jgi:hypothetical protein
MESLRKCTILLLFVLVATQSGMLIKRAWDDAKLERNKYGEISERNPVCLSERDIIGGFIISEADEWRQTYRGKWVIFARRNSAEMIMISFLFEKSFRELNSRGDLVRVDCNNGQRIEE